MKIEPLDQRVLSGKTYGYCKCGREVRKDKHKICPVCGNVFLWDKLEEER